MASPGSKVHNIVCLDAFLCPVPPFSIPHEYHEYQNTPEELIAERVKDATIVITTRVAISEQTLARAPNLELIAVMGIGFNTIDVEGCRKRKIVVCNCPGSSAEAVAEHAIALYFAAKRRVVDMHLMTMKAEEWPKKSSVFGLYPRLPVVCRHDVMGIIGYGALGKQIEIIAKALGMSVLIAERKGSNTVRPGRTAFVDTLRSCSVLMIGCPLDASTHNMIGEGELQLMQPTATVVNVARGGVMDESALVKALKEGTIASAAIDVFAIEPANSDSPFISEVVPNLTLSPHIAWYADSSLENLQRIVKINVEGFASGKPENVVQGSWSPLLA